MINTVTMCLGIIFVLNTVAFIIIESTLEVDYDFDDSYNDTNSENTIENDYIIV